ncbi:SDR family NAD(P)-dependent oxidoreductase [Pusillimonas sp.]|uniref:SDR family NAD(P)-dependent oxidoreductase n=1 Tax=Pusillimonas sp. TaxID=3040095 RepID=UPI0029A19B50|nr:SDR family NAD(P)-dependent oxidoreductase [Pusillimonas sp.]MDX3895333.1 SDR family NAD(P)-dependent oxidoreductase [Pusillimonas sp.]
MSEKQRIVIIGATSTIAEHCARLWLSKQAVDLTLVGRSAQRIERVAADLRVRSPESHISIMEAEFLDPVAINATVQAIIEIGSVDIVLIAHGSLPNQAECENDLMACRDALEINGISPVLYAEAFAKYMAQSNYGTIALIGSVAGDRGRKSNYIYGAAKGLIERYIQGLQHRFSGTDIKFVLIKPGPTDTPMTAHLKEKRAKLASVESVAKRMVAEVGVGTPVIYAPARWRVIMCIIRHLPRIIFNKLNI